MRYSDEAINIDKGEKRHEKALEYLVGRLSKKPGFHSIHEEYFGPCGTLRGEMDDHLIRKTTDGRTVHRYYEVKARYSDGAEARAIQQFRAHKKNHPGENWKYVLYAPGVFKQYRL